MKILGFNFIFFIHQTLCLDFLNSQSDSINNQISKSASSDSPELCTITNCPLFQGICFKNYCHCSHDYSTYITSETYPIIYCNYHLKSKYTAFFLELFFPFGVGHLYAENAVLAIIKFLSFTMILCSCCGILFSISLEHKNDGIQCFSLLFILMIVVWLLLQIIDLVCYSMAVYMDGNGFPLI
jgi:hypothetical protein